LQGLGVTAQTLNLTITVESEQALRTLGEIGEKDIRAVFPQALNAAARYVRTETTKFLRRELRLKAAVVKGKITLGKRATTSKPSAEIIGKFGSIAWPKVGAVSQTPTGASVSGKGVIPGSFVARMPTGHRGVFVRKQPTRPVGPGARGKPKSRGALPIVERKLQLFPRGWPEMQRLADRPARAVFVREFEARMRKRLERLRAKSATKAAAAS
jgi:hypothetical protein